MYVKFDQGIVDDELNTAREYLGMFDSKLTVLNSRIKNSIDPDGAGLCDQGEYLIGMGFAVAQRFLGTVLGQLKVSKSDAIKLGPYHKNGTSIASLVNATANYWKHHEEWDKSALNTQTARNHPHYFYGYTWAAYTCSNILAEISPDHLELCKLVTYLEAWRNEVIKGSL